MYGNATFDPFVIHITLFELNLHVARHIFSAVRESTSIDDDSEGMEMKPFVN
jgi:hypothetical protein